MARDALQPVIQGGRNRANLEAARAAYDEAVANYRQTVLTAFQQVEDGISNLSTLSKALSTQGAAVEDARKALEIANNRYVGGVTNYLDVITAQTTLLSNQRLETQLARTAVGELSLSRESTGRWLGLEQYQRRAGSSKSWPDRSAIEFIRGTRRRNSPARWSDDFSRISLSRNLLVVRMP